MSDLSPEKRAHLYDALSAFRLFRSAPVEPRFVAPEPPAPQPAKRYGPAAELSALCAAMALSRVEKGALTPLAAAAAVFDAFEQGLRDLERGPDGARDLQRSAQVRALAETRLARWRAKTLEPPFQRRELP